MRSVIANKFLRTALLPAFVLAHLFCVCGGAVASPVRAEVAAPPQTDAHACCKAPAPADQPDKSPAKDHKHNPSCTHCGDSSTLTTPEPATTLRSPHLLSFMLLVPSHFDHVAFDASTLFQSFSRWLADFSPPPDLLRVKCSMQI